MKRLEHKIKPRQWHTTSQEELITWNTVIGPGTVFQSEGPELEV